MDRVAEYTLDDLDKEIIRRYYKWIANVCGVLKWDVMKGADLIADPSWFYCYDDGMTPEEAVAEAVSKGVL